MIATKNTWGKTATSRMLKVQGLVQRPGTSDHVQIEVTGRQNALGGDMSWSFEACGPQSMTVRTGYVFRTQKAAQDASEVFAQHLLDFVARMPKPMISTVKAG